MSEIVLVTGGTTGLTDGTLVDESNRLVFTSTTPLEVHVRCISGYWSADQAFYVSEGSEAAIPLEVSFDDGATWEGWVDNPVCPEIEDVNFPVLIRQTEAIVGTLDTDFRTDGSYTAIEVLSTPTLTATVGGATQIDLSWTDVSNEDGYVLQRSPNGSTGWSTIATKAANETTHSDTGLSAGTRYWYRVAAVGSGRYGDSGWGTDDALPLAPGITHYTVGVNPVGLCEDQHGNVWAAARTDSQVQRITPGGTVTTFNLNAADAPTAIASDGTSLYVTHSTGMTKITGDLTGTPTLTRYTALGATYGIALGGDGYLYCTTAGTDIKKVDPSNCTLVTAWGTSGVKTTSGADFRYIVQGDSGFLYATDRTNNRVYKIAQANATANASIGTGPDASADFMDIAYNGTDLYLVGQGVGKIYRVTLAGAYTGTVIGASTSLVTGIAIGTDGRVYTAGYDASYKNIYSIAAGATPGTPTNHGALTAAANWDVLGHSNGTIWVAEYGSAKVARLVL